MTAKSLLSYSSWPLKTNISLLGYPPIQGTDL